VPNFVPDKMFMQKTFWSEKATSEYARHEQDTRRGATGAPLKGPYITPEQVGPPSGTMCTCTLVPLTTCHLC
jgi:hypothetical protein